MKFRGPQALNDTLEDLFHLVVVVLIQTTKLLWLLGALPLSADISVLRAVVRLNAQATVGPELSLAAEPVRGLHQRDQAGGSNRTDAGNLAQQFRGLVFPALGQKLGSQVAPQGLQSVQLLIEQFRPAAHAGLRNLAQPFLITATVFSPSWASSVPKRTPASAQMRRTAMSQKVMCFASAISTRYPGLPFR